MPTTYKTLRTTYNCHLAFPIGAEAIKANISTKPIVVSNAQKAHLLPLIRPDQIMNNASTERATAQEL
jgi:transposase-like protein